MGQQKTFHEIVTHLEIRDRLANVNRISKLSLKEKISKQPTNYNAPVPMSSEEKMQSNVKIVLKSLQTNTISGLELLLRRVTEIKNKRCTLMKRTNIFRYNNLMEN